jgi:hypothetical protein
MSDTPVTHQVEGDLSLSPITTHRQFGNSISAEMRKFYALRALETKNKIDQLGAEINQRQDKMRLINDIISEINSLTDDNNCLDISQNAALLEKLQIAQDLGVHLKEGKLKFNAIERDRLIENLHLSGDSWDKENRHQTQKMEIHVKELDRLMMLLKDADRKEDQAMRPALSGIRGGG